MDSAVASETPAASYVFALPDKRGAVYGEKRRALAQGDRQIRLPSWSRAAKPAIGPFGTIAAE
jgi:hypothetical protein